jgi:HSP20 family protein
MGKNKEKAAGEGSARAGSEIAPLRDWAPLAEWAPFRELGRLSRMMDELFGGFAARAPALPRWTPAIEVAETPDQYAVTVELPGARREDVHLELQDDVLTIRGEKRSEREEKDEKRHWVERSYGSFSRSFSLPANADGARVRASFKDGVLTVEIPKREEAKAKVIDIKSG